jgi:hypothetical protein
LRQMRTTSRLGIVLLLAAASAAQAENALLNPRFDFDLAGWNQTDPANTSWSTDDSNGAINSGSVRIDSAGPVGAAINQCILVVGGQPYDIQVNAKVETHGQTFAKVGIQVFWRTGADCENEVGGIQPFSLTGVTGEWQHLAVASAAPASATHALVQLVAVRFMGSEGSSITGWLDDAFVGPAGTATTLTTMTTLPVTTTTLGEPSCADPIEPFGKTTASDALFVLKSSVGAVICDDCICDANGNGTATASDALAVLRKAVGFAVTLDCGEACPPPA